MASLVASREADVVGVDGQVPGGPQAFELLLRFGEHRRELGALVFELCAGVGVIAHLEFFERHVELEGLFEQVGRGDLLLGRAGGLGKVGGRAGLLFELDAFKGEKIFGAGDGNRAGSDKRR